MGCGVRRSAVQIPFSVLAFGTQAIRWHLSIERTPNTQPRFGHDVRVDHRRLDVLMAEQLPPGAEVVAVLQRRVAE
jgi:hypothetical protein